MNRGAWWITVCWGHKESDTAEATNTLINKGEHQIKLILEAKMMYFWGGILILYFQQEIGRENYGRCMSCRTGAGRKILSYVELGLIKVRKKAQSKS